MNTLVVNLKSELTVNGKLQGDNMSGNDIRIDGTNDSVQLTSSTTPDVEYGYTDDLVCNGSAQTIDLYDGLTDPEGIALALNGKKPRAIKFRAKSTNAVGGVTVTVGASTAYLLLGAAFKFILLPGQHVLIYLAANAPDITSSLTNIDYTGTNLDVLEVTAVFG